jgi:hypothetical protein
VKKIRVENSFNLFSLIIICQNIVILIKGQHV